MRFRTLAESVPVLIWLSDSSGALIWFNQGWLQFTGRTLGEVLGDGWTKDIHPDDLKRCMATYQISREQRRAFSMEYRLRRHDGEYRWVLDQGVPLPSVRGFTGYLGSCMDIHERKQTEEERTRLLEHERRLREHMEQTNRMKDEFLSTLSHELRSPLNAILGWSQLMGRETVSPAQLKQGAAVIERNARSQATLIAGLLDMSRIISGKLKLDSRPVDMSLALRSSIETMLPTAQAKRITLQTVLPPSRAMIWGDANRLQQIVWNLLSNAVKFTPENGSIWVRLIVANEHVRLEVQDTGEGIEPSFLPFIFEKFRQADSSTTREHAGLGLGLSIVKHLAELHGGAVSADSAGKGQGSLFAVDLPLYHEQDHRGLDQHQPDREPLPGLKGLRALVLDDEADARLLVQTLLEAQGASVVAAGSAQEALRQFEAARPDIIISDIAMPEEDGYQFIRHIRSRPGGTTPAIALTAFATEKDRMRAFEAGYQAHISKPVEPATLLKTVDKLLVNQAVAH